MQTNHCTVQYSFIQIQVSLEACSSYLHCVLLFSHCSNARKTKKKATTNCSGPALDSFAIRDHDMPSTMGSKLGWEAWSLVNGLPIDSCKSAVFEKSRAARHPSPFNAEVIENNPPAMEQHHVTRLSSNSMQQFQATAAPRQKSPCTNGDCQIRLCG